MLIFFLQGDGVVCLDICFTDIDYFLTGNACACSSFFIVLLIFVIPRFIFLIWLCMKAAAYDIGCYVSRFLGVCMTYTRVRLFTVLAWNEVKLK